MLHPDTHHVAVAKRRNKPQPPESPKEAVKRLKKLASELDAASEEADVIAKKVREDIAEALHEYPAANGARKRRKPRKK